MDMADQELITEFVVESQEGLANIETQMLAIEASGANIDEDLVNAVFRTMHSIKGTAGFLGLDRIGALAHSLEEILNNLRNREVIPTEELVTSVLRAADYMKGLIDAAESSHDADIAPYVSELKRFRPGTPTEAAEASVATPGPRPGAAAIAPAAVLCDATRDFLVESCENLDEMERHLVSSEGAARSEQLVRSIFRTMHTVKGGAGFLGLSHIEQLAHASENLLGQLRDGHREWSVEATNALLAAVDQCRLGLHLVETTGTEAGFDPSEIIEHMVALHHTVAPLPSEGTVAGGTHDTTGSGTPSRSPVSTSREQVAERAEMRESPSREPSGNDSAPSAATPDKAATSLADSTIRVDVALLDKLMTGVGELVLARNQILQCTSGREDAVLLGAAQRLNLITSELQEGVMKTRMQPIGNVWSKFPRVVRDLAAQLGKHVRIEMEGKETELDKTIIEAIKDPLTHLVRNSVDHGIESPEVRRAAGKPAEGQLSLRAYHEGGHVNIEIADDGGGLNFTKIRQKAVERALITPVQASSMSEHEVAQLILLPGFSTADKITSVSGRGVGMDVVKTNIERIGGILDLKSTPDQGTTIKVTIPLTLAIIPALIVTNDGDRYAIPQASLVELVRLDGEQARRGIEQVNGAPVYRLRGKLLPLVYLSRALSTGTSDDGRHASLSGLFSGGAGDIDLSLARARHLAWKQRLRNYLDGKEEIKLDEARSPRACALGKWLYGEQMQAFRHHPTVERLERDHAEMHATVGRVIQHHNRGDIQGAEGILAEVEHLSHQVVGIVDELQSLASSSHCINIVVLRANDRQFGLVVDRVNDTEEIVVKPLGRHLKAIRGYAGATIMGDGSVALILDVMGLAVSAGLAGEMRDAPRLSSEAGTAGASQPIHPLMLVDVGDARRFALPVSLVSRLEKMPPSAIEYADGREVVQYRGAILPLIHLDSTLGHGAGSDSAPRNLQIIVYEEQGKSVGLVVHHILDVVETELRFDSRRPADHLLLGTMVIQNHVCDVLNLSSLARRALGS